MEKSLNKPGVQTHAGLEHIKQPCGTRTVKKPTMLDRRTVPSRSLSIHSSPAAVSTNGVTTSTLQALHLAEAISRPLSPKTKPHRSRSGSSHHPKEMTRNNDIGTSTTQGQDGGDHGHRHRTNSSRKKAPKRHPKYLTIGAPIVGGLMAPAIAGGTIWTAATNQLGSKPAAQNASAFQGAVNTTIARAENVTNVSLGSIQSTA